MATTIVANKAGGRSFAAVVTIIALVAASMLTVGVDARRFNHGHGGRHRHHSPPAPPGYNDTMAAPSPYFGDEPVAAPAYSPDAYSPGSLPNLPESFSEGPGSAADSPDAFEGPATYAPELGC